MSSDCSSEHCNDKPYHHGDLHNALIVAAAELIQERGSTEFTMAEAARRAGVSNAAPYRHFKDRDALLQAVADLAFWGLASCMQKAAAQHPKGSRECITALMHNYLKFCRQHSAFQDLMWSNSVLCSAELSANANAHLTGFNVLEEAVASWCEQENLPRHTPLELSVQLWGLTHGLNRLDSSGHVAKLMPDADVYSLIKRSADTFLDGVSKPT